MNSLLPCIILPDFEQRKKFVFAVMDLGLSFAGTNNRENVVRRLKEKQDCFMIILERFYASYYIIETYSTRLLLKTHTLTNSPRHFFACLKTIKTQS